MVRFFNLPFESFQAFIKVVQVQAASFLSRGNDASDGRIRKARFRSRLNPGRMSTMNLLFQTIFCILNSPDGN